jgi:hypothetical protein
MINGVLVGTAQCLLACLLIGGGSKYQRVGWEGGDWALAIFIMLLIFGSTLLVANRHNH